MANNTADNVILGSPVTGTGALFRAPVGTALPTEEDTAKNVAFKNLGFISADGVKRNIGQDSSEILAAGGTVVRVIQSKHKVTYKFTLLETNVESLKVFHGDDNVTATAGSPTDGARLAVEVVAGVVQRDSWIIETIDGDWMVREVIPNAEVTARGETTVVTNGSGDGVRQYDIELTAYEDSAGVKAYVYHDNGILVP